MKWIDFDIADFENQVLPPENKPVLCLGIRNLTTIIAVGYLVYCSGNKDEPFFKVPGFGNLCVLGWSDCLEEGFKFPDYKQLKTKYENKYQVNRLETIIENDRPQQT